MATRKRKSPASPKTNTKTTTKAKAKAKTKTKAKAKTKTKSKSKTGAKPKRASDPAAIRRSRTPTRPSKELLTFPNPNPERDYEIRIETPEFTCICPVTGQPDFAHVHIVYVPDRLCVELKSLKLYLWSYRDEGAYHEAVTNKILDDLVDALAPRSMTCELVFRVRGGITTTVRAHYEQP